MIEKPKRPKKPDIQERQPPRTLQELVNRYDLDNTKVYDFLDELVELLNTEKESIDTSINDLNNKKVNKSGDTMTGSLALKKTSYNYNNGAIPGTKQATSNTIADLINELRYTNGQMGSVNITTAYTLNNKTIATGWYNYLYIPHRIGGIDGGADGDNANYGTLILTGMTMSTPMYAIRYSSSGIARLQSFISLDSKSDGLYNETSGKKLVEQITTEWIYASRQNLTEGTIRYQKIGNIAIVHIADLKSSSNLGNGTVLATGLPKGATGYLFLLSRYNSSGSDTDCRVRINENGELYIHYDTFYSGDNQYYGQAIYLCQ